VETGERARGELERKRQRILDLKEKSEYELKKSFNQLKVSGKSPAPSREGKSPRPK